eukprot:6888540-Pyramimonas_sp.AAC.1
MLASWEAMVHCFLRAAVLESNLWLGRRANPENGFHVEGFEVHGPFSSFTNFDLQTDLDVMVFDALD